MFVQGVGNPCHFDRFITLFTILDATFYSIFIFVRHHGKMGIALPRNAFNYINV